MHRRSFNKSVVIFGLVSSSSGSCITLRGPSDFPCKGVLLFCPTTFPGRLCLRYLSISSDLCLAHVKGEVGASLGISRRTGNSFTNQEPGGCISGNGLVYPRRLVYTGFSHNYHACHIHQSAYTPNTAIGVYFSFP